MASASSSSSTVAAATPSAPTDNSRGIPAAPFVSVVEDFIGGPEGDVDATLAKFQEMTAKYRYMDLSLRQKQKGLMDKIPDIEKTLNVVDFLLERKIKRSKASEPDELEEEIGEDDEDLQSDKPIKTLFELNDTLFAEAQVEETGDVYLWLGANVMLSYPLEEALELLQGKLSGAQSSLKTLVEDLEFLKDQITVMEVNTARVFNFDVKRRRDRKAREEAEGTVAGGVLASKKDKEEDESDR